MCFSAINESFHGTRMRERWRTTLQLLAVALALHCSEAEVVCYACYGESETNGSYCSNGNLCSGESCYFNVNDTGTWQAGCASTLSSTSTNQSCTSNGSQTNCACTSDFCNKLETTIAILKDLWASEGKSVTPYLPSDIAVPCFECGDIDLNGTVIYLPCDRNHLCHGGYCMTVKGVHPYSLCATSWEGSSEVRCYKAIGQTERCVCAGQMCNFPYDPDKIPTTPATTTTTSVAGVTVECPDGYQWNPNQQAVHMGQKLKDLILNGFGNAAQNFATDMDTHICGYSEHSRRRRR